MGVPVPLPMSLSDINSKAHITAARGELRINCPYCEDTDFHCYVSTIKLVYHCFKCNASGKVTNEQEVDLTTFKDICFDDVVSKVNQVIHKQVKNLPICQNISSILHPKQYRYLRSRGVTPWEMEEHNIAVCTEVGSRYSDSIVFPIYDGEQVEYFVTRNRRGTPKYMNAPWAKGSTCFVAEPKHASTHTHNSDAVICEGVFDALAIARAGFTAVSLLGKRANTFQLEKLVKQGLNYILFLDSDAFAYSIELSLQLRTMGDLHGREVHTYVTYLSGLDPADAVFDDPQRVTDLLEDADAHFTKH